MIQIKVDGSVVSVQETEALYCGSQDVYTCCFVFDKSWNKFGKSAVFRSNGRVITAAIDDDNCCTLPWELLVRSNIGLAIDVGVYGVSAEAEIMTSVWDSIGDVREGSEIGNDAREPSAGIYEQIMANVQKVDEKVTNYNTEVQTQVQRAESAATVAVDRAEQAAESAASSKNDAEMTRSAREAVLAAVNNLPAGSTLIINDLTTGGTRAALSAEMGKTLNQNKIGKSDKPTGSYQGTGSAATQTFNVGGIGKCVYIYGGSLAAIIGPNGGIAWNGNGRTMQTIATSEGTFQDGVLTISTDSYYLNSSTLKYYYRVL